MGKIKLIGTLALAALLLVLVPATALAQLSVPMNIYGKVSADGKNVADGTAVVASVDGAKIGETTTYTAGGVSNYALVINGSASLEGKPIKFKIGTADAQQTGTFQAYKSTNIDLTVGAALPVTGDETVPLAIMGMAALGVIALSAGYGLRRRMAHAA